MKEKIQNQNMIRTAVYYYKKKNNITVKDYFRLLWVYIPSVGRNCGVRVLVSEENIVAEYSIKVDIDKILIENTARGEAEYKMNGKGEEKK